MRGHRETLFGDPPEQEEPPATLDHALDGNPIVLLRLAAIADATLPFTRYIFFQICCCASSHFLQRLACERELCRARSGGR